MKRMLPFASLLLALTTPRLSAQQLIINGDFELPGEITNGWSYTQTTGSFPSRSAFYQSPFANEYSAGNSGIFIEDAANNGGLRLQQDFIPQYGPTYFSFDFYNMGFGLGWSIGLNDSDGGFASEFSFFVRQGSPLVGITNLTSGTWYNVQGVIDPSDKSVIGAVTAYGEMPVPYATSVPTSFDNVASFFVTDEGGGGRSDSLPLDNVSVRPVPEPHAPLLLGLGAALWLLRKRARVAFKTDRTHGSHSTPQPACARF